MIDLGNTFQHMGFGQVVLLFGFVTAYVLALGRLLGAAARWRAGLLAMALAAAFVSRTTPWEHGALLVVFVIGAMGLYVAMVWLMATLVAPSRGLAAAQAQADETVSAGAVTRAAPRSAVAATETVAGALR